MAALNKCLLEHKPSPYLANRLRLLSDAYKGDPLASNKAAEDMLAELQAERAGLVKQIEKAGGVIPKPAESKQRGGNEIGGGTSVKDPNFAKKGARGELDRDVTPLEQPWGKNAAQRAMFDDGSGPTGAPPSPKALAAKQAAFLEKARSGDAEFLKTLASSTDAKGLQRAVMHVASSAHTRNVQKSRIGDELNKTTGQVTNSLLTALERSWAHNLTLERFDGYARANFEKFVVHALQAQTAEEHKAVILAATQARNAAAQIREALAETDANAALLGLVEGRAEVSLGKAMSAIAKATSNEALRVVARAVKTISPDTPVVSVSRGVLADGMLGAYNVNKNIIALNGRFIHAAATTAVHEGVHAATLKGLADSPELYNAAYKLLQHAVAANPEFAASYGSFSVLEFMAEGLSNAAAQGQLRMTPASAEVRSFIAGAKNLWDGFVGLIRKALGLDAQHESALSQLFDLTGMAMIETKRSPSPFDGTADRIGAATLPAFKKDFEAAAEALRAIAPNDIDAIDTFLAEVKGQPNFNQLLRVESLVEHIKNVSDADRPFLTEVLGFMLNGPTEKVMPFLGANYASRVGPSHNISKTIDTINARLSELVQAPGVALGMQTKKYSLQSDVLHASLGRPGFGATHDSPTKHDGRFDWRTHAMTGEGAMVKGAGTYLSTSDGVHTYYKKAFSGDSKTHMNNVLDYELDLARKESPNDAAAIRESVQENIRESLHELDDGHRDTYYEALRLLAKMTDAQLVGDKSPTYHVSVDIAPEQLMDWDKPLSEQSEFVKSRAMQTFRELFNVPENDPLNARVIEFTGADLYQLISQKFGGLLGTSDHGSFEDDTKTSDALQAAGILGHRMKASTKDGDVNPNYVIYDDSKITTNYVHFDQTRADPNAFGPQDRATAEAYLKRVAPDVALAWANILHAGEFEQTKTGDVIRLSVHALNPTSVAYHESLHALFAQLRKDGQGDIMDVLNKAGESAPVLNQLKKLLNTEPAALAQLNDPEERAAYMYQFYQLGKLNVGPKVESVFQRIAQFIRKVTGLWTNDERAELIMNYFHSGEYAANRADLNAVRRATMDTGAAPALAWAKSATAPLRDLGNTLAVAGGARLRDTGIPALRELADIMKLKTTSEGQDPGYLPAARAEHSRFMNGLATALKPYSPEVMREALEILQTGDKPVATPANLAARTVAKVIRTQLDERLAYMQAAGVRIDAIGLKDGVPYFPRSYDASYISSHQRQFLAMLDRNGVDDSAAVMRKVMVTDGAEFTVEVDKPGMQHAKIRKLAFIPHAEVAPFMRKDLFQILNSYSQQASRRAEWARRLGDDGAGVAALLTKAEAQGATPKQLDTARQFVRAVDGTLGDNLNPTARRLYGDMLVYQNIRLLPLAIFSSIVDPMGLMVRGGGAREAFTAFKRGIKETVKNFQRNPDSDDATALAEAIGTVESAILIHTIGSSHTQGMVGDRVRGWNDTFFRLNLMDQWNRSMRVGATEAAMSFLVRHSTKPGQHSARYLRELGLTAADVQLDANGRPKILESDGLTLEQSAKMKAAVNRWVDGAVLRPDAVDKAIWMNDPHYAVVAHLKQFVFSFHETILKRVVHEYKEGNYTPAMALASYIPVMLAADTIKGLIQGGGEEPPWKAGWTAGDYLWHATERAGLFGVNQFSHDAMTDIGRGGVGVGALLGPTVNQLVDAAGVLGGNHQFEPFFLKSLPANALYAEALK